MRRIIATLDRIVGELNQIDKELVKHHDYGLLQRTPLLSSQVALRKMAKEMEEEAKR